MRREREAPRDGAGNAPSPLIAAVTRMEEELRRYEALVAEVARAPISSEKTLARTARAVSEAAACHQRFLACVVEVSAALSETRARQESTLVRMAEAAQDVGMRADGFLALLERYRRLGDVARALNERASGISAGHASGTTADATYAAVGELLEGMTAALAEAETIAAAGRANGYEQISRDADALKQQMAAAKNRLTLAHRTLAERVRS
jgi:hypothetical protein